MGTLQKNVNVKMLQNMSKRRLTEYDHYKKYEKLIYSFVYKYRWMDDFDTILSAAHSGYMRAVETYDPNKGAFSTHLTWSIKGAIHSCIKVTKEHNIEQYYSICSPVVSPLDNAIFSETIDRMSKEARFVVDMILDMPDGLVEFTKDKNDNYHMTARTIRMYLVNELGWKHSVTDNVFEEIRGALK